MNILLLDANDFLTAERVRVEGPRRDHIVRVLKAKCGDRLRVGRMNGLLGSGEIVKLGAESIDLVVRLDRQPPPALPATLILALPRPKMLRRILQAISSLGVKKIFLINSARVDKSYWHSPLLQPGKLREQLLLGLEQAGDTQLGTIHLRRRFKPFVEDELAQIAWGTRGLVAHPAEQEAVGGTIPAGDSAWTVVIGPEGGLVPFELELLHTHGLTPISLGPRILRVETAVPVLLGQLLAASSKEQHVE